MTAKEDLPSLESLGQRLDEARQQQRSEQPDDSSPASGAGDAMRLGLELVAGVGVGAGLGFALDHWLGTSPWLLLVCFFFGCAAGFMNLKRAAARLNKDSPSSPESR